MIIADLHTHTVASDHAFNTVTEMARYAAQIGLAAIAITDHGMAMPDAPHPWHFFNLIEELPFVMEGIPVLKGVEANVLNAKGELDFSTEQLKPFDWVVASIHTPVIQTESLTKKEATKLWCAIAENPYVDLIGHSELPQYEYDYDLVTKRFAEHHKVVEMNANSCVVRPAGKENMRRLAIACMKNATPIAVNSDAHSIYRIAQVQHIFELLNEIDFPQELIVNSSKNRFLNELKYHNHKTAEKLGGIWND